jgi:serine/threonine protein kinase
VFEYVEGETLEERLQRGPLTAAEAARLSRELGGALSEAHAAQIVHRDIKPENVLLAKRGAVIADFGIARLPDSTSIRPGGLLGTPAYSAPEAIAEGSFSPQSDQFSMACTLFEAISARRAFPGDDAGLVAELVQTTEPAELARQFRLDASVDTVLARAFSKHPLSRFASCDEFGRALAEALETPSRATLITEPDGYHRALAVPRQSRAGSVVGAALLTLGLVAVFALVYESGWRVRFAQSEPLPRHGAAASEGRDEVALTPVVWLYERLRPSLNDERALGQPTVADGASRSLTPDAGAGSR